MKIAIDISPLSSGHNVRGTGFYLEHLKNALQNYCPQHEYFFFNQKAGLPEVDLIHYPYFDPFFLTLPIRLEKKTVVTVHDLTPLVFPSHFPAGLKGILKWQIQKFALSKSTHIITDSESSKKDILKIVGYPKEDVSVVYLAAGEQFKQISQTEIKKVKEKYNLPEKFILYTGDVTWNKNLPALVEACIHADLPLVLVGKALVQEKTINNAWLHDLQKVQNLVRSNKNIFRLGFIPTEDLVALYNSATVFAMPSFYEGFGLPILEAMACGTPVVTTACGSLSEVAGNAALIVEPTRDAIMRGITHVYSDKSVQSALREKGLEHVKKFSWRKTAEETVRVYEKVFNSK